MTLKFGGSDRGVYKSFRFFLIVAATFNLVICLPLIKKYLNCNKTGSLKHKLITV